MEVVVDLLHLNLVFEQNDVVDELLDGFLRVGQQREAVSDVTPLALLLGDLEAVAKLLDQSLDLTVLADEPYDVLHDQLVLAFLQLQLGVAQAADDVRQNVVQNVGLVGDLLEEHFGGLVDLVVRVDEAHGEVGDLTLHQDHLVGNQMREDSDRRQAQIAIRIVERWVQIGAPRLDDVREAEGEVAHADDDVALDVDVLRMPEDVHEELHVLLAKLRADGHQVD